MPMDQFIWKPFSIDQHKIVPKVVGGKGLYLQLEDGRQIKDMVSSWWVNLHGHTHPKIVKAISDQAEILEHVIFADYTHEPAEKLAKLLIESMGHAFNKVFYSDNGSTAVEVALKMALQYWKNLDQPSRNLILAFEGAYHGDTFGAMSASGRSTFSRPFDDWLFDVVHVPYPATYIGDNNIVERETTILSQVSSIFEKNPNKFAALIIEPLIQGAGGMRMCSPDFLNALNRLASSFDVLVIYDEFMTGFGRTGTLYAWNQMESKPDICCLAKGLTGGFLPMAVTLTTSSIFETFDRKTAINTFWHGHSYTANPLGCAASIASLELLNEYPHSFSEVAEHQEKEFNTFIKDVKVQKPRLMGTISAFEIEAREGEESGYFNTLASEIKEMALNRGLLVRPLGNTIYLMPPYCITESELSEVYIALRDIVKTIQQR